MGEDRPTDGDLSFPPLQLLLRPTCSLTDGLETTVPCLCFEATEIREYLNRPVVKSNMLQIKSHKTTQYENTIENLIRKTPKAWLFYVRPSPFQDVVWRALSLIKNLTEKCPQSWASNVSFYFFPSELNPGKCKKPDNRDAVAAFLFPSLAFLRFMTPTFKFRAHIASNLPEFKPHERIWANAQADYLWEKKHNMHRSDPDRQDVVEDAIVLPETTQPQGIGESLKEADVRYMSYSQNPIIAQKAMRYFRRKYLGTFYHDRQKQNVSEIYVAVGGPEMKRGPWEDSAMQIKLASCDLSPALFVSPRADFDRLDACHEHSKDYIPKIRDDAKNRFIISAKQAFNSLTRRSARSTTRSFISKLNDQVLDLHIENLNVEKLEDDDLVSIVAGKVHDNARSIWVPS